MRHAVHHPGVEGILIGPGRVDQGDVFAIRSQFYQGFAVWRATGQGTGSEPPWQLIGLLDLTNPEFCFEDDCDAPNWRSLRPVRR